ncbi:DUF3870 domain-containing protein [Fundicoccus culcitae]|uniref:DUF3870 domain-containing protein n=1 Tax=Fundicoccus culcitae TaxID=2969821 RepID=A0ABY5P5B8_9LACT|nr:DUF3870 domain-containing protein [Fundicoccus culcitae]UUX33570.1 DUF3870 domain-containing protein [Fundicoccus culcitae]
MNYSDNSVYITGQGRIGKNDAIGSVYSIFALSLIIDRDTEIIEDVDCTAALGLTGAFVRQLMVGKRIIADADEIIKQIQERFFGTSRNALLTAFKDSVNRYKIEFK